MKKLLSTLILALTIVGLLSSLAVPALAFTPTAEAPVWTEGTQWAYGSETDVGASFADALENLTGLLEYQGTVNELSLDGETDFWLLFEVTEANDTEYVLSMDMATKASLAAAISFSSLMEVAGTYDISETPEEEEITVSADVDVDAALVMNVEMTFDKDTMAIKSVTLDLKISASVDFVADNIPNEERDITGYDWVNMTDIGTVTYDYEDYDVSGNLEMNLAMDLSFAPALNIWDFPLSVGESWTVSSEATLSGNFDGSLDIEGLPEEMEENIFSEEMYNMTGFTDFPIIFEEIHGLAGIPIDEGVIEETTTDQFDLDMECVDYFTRNDDYLGEIGVYEIQVGGTDSPMVYYYSPDVGFMSNMMMDTDELGSEIEQYIGADMTTMAAVDPQVAEDNIAEIADYQGGVTDESQSGIAGFFTEAPYLGLILIGVIVVVVVAAVMLMRKKK